MVDISLEFVKRQVCQKKGGGRCCTRLASVEIRRMPLIPGVCHSSPFVGQSPFRPFRQTHQSQNQVDDFDEMVEMEIVPLRLRTFFLEMFGGRTSVSLWRTKIARFQATYLAGFLVGVSTHIRARLLNPF